MKTGFQGRSRCQKEVTEDSMCTKRFRLGMGVYLLGCDHENVFKSYSICLREVIDTSFFSRKPHAGLSGMLLKSTDSCKTLSHDNLYQAVPVHATFNDHDPF